jgi:hypothetical protein
MTMSVPISRGSFNRLINIRPILLQVEEVVETGGILPAAGASFQKNPSRHLSFAKTS